jgi:hypothetical protein
MRSRRGVRKGAHNPCDPAFEKKHRSSPSLREKSGESKRFGMRIVTCLSLARAEGFANFFRGPFLPGNQCGGFQCEPEQVLPKRLNCVALSARASFQSQILIAASGMRVRADFRETFPPFGCFFDCCPFAWALQSPFFMLTHCSNGFRFLAFLALGSFLHAAEVGVRIRFGLKDQENTVWSGSAEVDSGRVDRISGWRFQFSDSVEGNAWKAETRSL